ncbi:MAG: hypothetical protein DMF82_07020, partial [Acidobacteria bacterium]
SGYLWLFPRPDHVGVGICAPLAGVPTKAMLARLEREVAVSFPAMIEDEAPRYAHTIPSPSADPRSILEIAGPRWALVGDAAALADPITGEGIFFALCSATVLAQTLRETGSPATYPARALEDFGRELNKAAALRDRFYSPGLARRMIAYARRSRAIRGAQAKAAPHRSALPARDRQVTPLLRRVAWPFHAEAAEGTQRPPRTETESGSIR